MRQRSSDLGNSACKCVSSKILRLRIHYCLLYKTSAIVKLTVHALSQLLNLPVTKMSSQRPDNLTVSQEDVIPQLPGAKLSQNFQEWLVCQADIVLYFNDIET